MTAGSAGSVVFCSVVYSRVHTMLVCYGVHVCFIVAMLAYGVTACEGAVACAMFALLVLYLV